jgi:hypothetical protein
MGAFELIGAACVLLLITAVVSGGNAAPGR